LVDANQTGLASHSFATMLMAGSSIDGVLVVGRAVYACSLAAMFLITTSIVLASSSAGLNSTMKSAGSRSDTLSLAHVTRM
jgi:hypothetical protein